MHLMRLSKFKILLAFIIIIGVITNIFISYQSKKQQYELYNEMLECYKTSEKQLEYVINKKANEEPDIYYTLSCFFDYSGEYGVVKPCPIIQIDSGDIYTERKINKIF